MSVPQLVLLAFLPVLLGVSGFCTAAEVATFSLTPTDVSRLKRAHPRAGASVARLLERPRTLLLSILLLANASNVTYFVVSAVAGSWAGSRLVQVVVPVGAAIGLIVLADLLPLMLARRLRVEFCRLAARPLVVAVRVLGPISRFLENLAVVPLSRLLRPAGAEGTGRVVTVEELGVLLELSARQGVIHEDEQQLLADVVGLAALRVRDVMTPRVAMAWIEDTAPPARVLAAIAECPYNRIPVFASGREGHVAGLLDVTRYLAAGAESPTAPALAACLAPAIFVPERARLDQLLENFRVAKESETDLALSVDEYGTVVGMVTLDDVLRQLVGDPMESAESTGLEPVRQTGPNQWIVPGRLPVRELTGGTLRDGVSTVAGLFFQRLGRVPRPGDQVRVDNILLRVEAMRGRIVDRVSVSAERPSGVAGATGAAA